MEYKYLGKSALKVSPICLGAMMFGGATDETTAKRIMDKAYDQGINFIDTADVYNARQSELIVGRAIAAQRDEWVVATSQTGRAWVSKHRELHCHCLLANVQVGPSANQSV